MTGPGPSAAELDRILAAGVRVPDHGKLTPWRFIVFEGEGRRRMGDILASADRRRTGRFTGTRSRRSASDSCARRSWSGVVSRVREQIPIPVWEQQLVRGRGLHEHRDRRACAGLCRKLDHRMVRLSSRGAGAHRIEADGADRRIYLSSASQRDCWKTGRGPIFMR